MKCVPMATTEFPAGNSRPLTHRRDRVANCAGNGRTIGIIKLSDVVGNPEGTQWRPLLPPECQEIVTGTDRDVIRWQQVTRNSQVKLHQVNNNSEGALDIGSANGGRCCVGCDQTHPSSRRAS